MLLGGVPDPVVCPRLGKVVAAARSRHALGGDHRFEQASRLIYNGNIGDPLPDHDDARAIVKDLVGRQRGDGAWPKADDSHMSGDDGTLLNTTWALQILNMKRSVLPIFER